MSIVGRNGKTRLQLAAQIGLIAVILVTWQLGAVASGSPVFPSFTEVLQSYLGILFGERLLLDVAPSVLRAVSGFAIGVTAGAVVGMTIGYSRPLEPWLRPLLEFLRAIPTVALLPPALLLLGATDEMRIALIAFGCFFPVLLAAIDGTRRVDPLYLDTSRVLRRTRAETLFQVVLPSALPAILAGIRIALGMALILMVISELSAASDGLGYFILQSQRLFRTVDVYAGTLVIGTIGVLFTAGILAIERRLLRWHRGWRGSADA
ncbi:ABC transporter permease subunit [Microbacterium sp. MEC084]|uniref:ABC transporter permease n=1 Tax=Microbacterium sp. MEC084 TaxID=1963027 RepID=UPI00106F7FD1|nr:ABC transporter permease [Microbacterium sp. MEC084]MCD1269946.1 ABC transporter permease subunit [Microbacterium sp. MEC084]